MLRVLEFVIGSVLIVAVITSGWYMASVMVRGDRLMGKDALSEGAYSDLDQSMVPHLKRLRIAAYSGSVLLSMTGAVLILAFIWTLDGRWLATGIVCIVAAAIAIFFAHSCEASLRYLAKRRAEQDKADEYENYR